MKHLTLALFALCLLPCWMHGQDLAISLSGDALKKKALEAIAAKYPDIKATDLQLNDLDLKYSFSAGFPPEAATKSADTVAVLTFLILPSRVDSEVQIPSGKKVQELQYQTLEVSLYFERQPLLTTVYKKQLNTHIE